MCHAEPRREGCSDVKCTFSRQVECPAAQVGTTSSCGACRNPFSSVDLPSTSVTPLADTLCLGESATASLVLTTSTRLVSLTLSAPLTESAVPGLWLWNARTETAIMPLHDGSVIDLGNLASTNGPLPAGDTPPRNANDLSIVFLVCRRVSGVRVAEDNLSAQTQACLWISISTAAHSVSRCLLCWVLWSTTCACSLGAHQPGSGTILHKPLHKVHYSSL